MSSTRSLTSRVVVHTCQSGMHGCCEASQASWHVCAHSRSLTTYPLEAQGPEIPNSDVTVVRGREEMRLRRQESGYCPPVLLEDTDETMPQELMWNAPNLLMRQKGNVCRSTSCGVIHTVKRNMHKLGRYTARRSTDVGGDYMQSALRRSTD